jgi:hypothetical protein
MQSVASSWNVSLFRTCFHDTYLCESRGEHWGSHEAFKSQFRNALKPDMVAFVKILDITKP